MADKCPCGKPAHHSGFCPADPFDMDEGELQSLAAVAPLCGCCPECQPEVCPGVLQGAGCDGMCTCPERDNEPEDGAADV